MLTLIPLDLGIEFLQTQGPRFAQQVEFMSQYNLMRPSDAKKRSEVQVRSGELGSHGRSTGTGVARVGPGLHSWLSG